MELNDKRQIEIFHTLEKIERMNKAIAFHKAMENPDKLALEQYEQLKKELTKQLLSLFKDMDIKLRMVA